jgi:hypothetical protein
MTPVPSVRLDFDRDFVAAVGVDDNFAFLDGDGTVAGDVVMVD